VLIPGRGHRNRHHPAGPAYPANRGEAHRPGHDPACRLAGEGRIAVVNVSRTIECANFWDALILRSLLEEQGVQVRQSDEVMRLSMVASGDLDQIKAAVAQLGNEFPRSGRVIIEGEPREDRTLEPSGEPRPPEPVRPAERSARPKPISEPEPASASAPAQALEPAQEVEPTQAAEPAPAPEPPPAPEPEPEPPDSLELTHTPEQPEPIPLPEPASEPPPPEPAPAPELTQVLGPTQAVEPTQAAEPVPAPESPPASEPPHDGEPSHPPQQPEPFPAPEPTQVLEPAQAAEPPESPELTHTPEQPEPLPAPESASEGQRWAVLYDDGMSLTTASERIARSLAGAERQRGRRVTVRRLDDVQTHPRGVEKPAGPPGRTRGEGPVRPNGTDEPSVPGSSRAVRGADTAPEPMAVRRLNENRTRPRRRLLLYVLAAASIVVAAALVDHWGVLPRVGANTSSSPTQVGGPAQRPQLLPPLDQTPVMHFSNPVDATSPPAEPSAQPTSPAAGPSGAQNLAARPTGSPTSAESPQPATGDSSGGGPSTIARGG
jgi:hypothetical protein